MIRIRPVILVLFFLLVTLGVRAQDYSNAIGLRGGLYNGISFKHFLSNGNAMEAILTTRWQGVLVAGLYEWQHPIRDIKQFSWFVGAGAHAGVFSGTLHPWYSPAGGTDSFVAGVDGIIGIEYVIREFPLDLALDYKPSVNLIGGQRLNGDEFALTFRYYW